MSKFDKLTTSVSNTQKSQEGKKSKTDPRFLNYYSLDAEQNQSIMIRFLPINDSGEIFMDYNIHTHPNRDIKSIQCSYTSNGESCVVCAKSYNAYKAGDKANQKLWNKNEKTMAQVVVVNSDVTIDVADDANLVKLFLVPYGIKKEVMKAIDNGLVTNIMATNFVIKKVIDTKSKRANYDNSFFNTNAKNEIPQEFMSSFEDEISYLYDVAKEIPPVTNAQDMVEWLAVAEIASVAESTVVTNPTATEDMEKILAQATANTTGSAPVEETKAPVEETKAPVDNSDALLAMLGKR